ncbi:hypothetical protein GCM10017784_03020 [Deinococcus indicus]|nr:hypothetical protein GCM10017784_03020 [Deinococcus indicus]
MVESFALHGPVERSGGRVGSDGGGSGHAGTVAPAGAGIGLSGHRVPARQRSIRGPDGWNGPRCPFRPGPVLAHSAGQLYESLPLGPSGLYIPFNRSPYQS